MNKTFQCSKRISLSKQHKNEFKQTKRCGYSCPGNHGNLMIGFYITIVENFPSREKSICGNEYLSGIVHAFKA